MSGPRECRGPGLFSSFQDRVDCSRRLAIVLAEQVCVDTQSDVRLGVAKALADRHDVDASIDQLAGVSVPQGVKRHFRHTDTLGVIAPSRLIALGESGAPSMSANNRSSSCSLPAPSSSGRNSDQQPGRGGQVRRVLGSGRESPLLAQSGHAVLHRTCPLLTQSGRLPRCPRIVPSP